MKIALKKEVATGLIISAVILGTCCFIGGTGGGPCNAGIGFITDFFILLAAILFFAMFMFVREPSVSLTAKTVVIALTLSLVVFFAMLLFI